MGKGVGEGGYFPISFITLLMTRCQPPKNYGLARLYLFAMKEWGGDISELCVITCWLVGILKATNLEVRTNMKLQK